MSLDLTRSRNWYQRGHRAKLEKKPFRKTSWNTAAVFGLRSEVRCTDRLLLVSGWSEREGILSRYYETTKIQRESTDRYETPRHNKRSPQDYMAHLVARRKSEPRKRARSVCRRSPRSSATIAYSRNCSTRLCDPCRFSDQIPGRIFATVGYTSRGENPFPFGCVPLPEQNPILATNAVLKKKQEETLHHRVCLDYFFHFSFETLSIFHCNKNTLYTT